MKKIDKLIFSSFIGPFILTFVVVVFILLNVQMLKYYDDIMGKGLSTGTLAQLFLYFSIFVTPTAFPLAVLLSSLMTFGALGEHFELTAIKSAGISLLRALVPIFIFVLGLSGIAFYSNNTLVPMAALEAYSLLYDIKQKKPALDIKEGIFYQGIPDFSIKVNEKGEDGQSLKDVIIYDHRNSSGNKKVTIAESGKMQMILNDRYLKLELFDGNTYIEGAPASGAGTQDDAFMRSSFHKNQVVMDLSSFAMEETDKSLFQSNRIMRNLSELVGDVDSMKREKNRQWVALYNQRNGAFFYHNRNENFDLPPDLQAFKRVDDSIRATYRTEFDTTAMKGENGDAYRSGVTINTDTSTGQTISDSLVTGISDSLVDEADVYKNIRELAIADSIKAKTTDSVPVVSNPAQPIRSRISENINEPELVPENENRRTFLTEAQKRQTTRAIKKILQSDSIPDAEDLKQYVMSDSLSETQINTALSLARQTKMKIMGTKTQIERMEREKDIFAIQYHKILSNAIACVIMFLIGAPLGAIIKRGGLGIPVLVSIIFFIIFYVISMQGEKWAKADIIDPLWGIWAANLVLLPIGLLFLRQARNDVRLFEADFYNVLIDRFKQWRKKNKMMTVK